MPQIHCSIALKYRDIAAMPYSYVQPNAIALIAPKCSLFDFTIKAHRLPVNKNLKIPTYYLIFRFCTGMHSSAIMRVNALQWFALWAGLKVWRIGDWMRVLGHIEWINILTPAVASLIPPRYECEICCCWHWYGVISNCMDARHKRRWAMEYGQLKIVKIWYMVYQFWYGI